MESAMSNVLFPTPASSTIQMDWGHTGVLTAGTRYITRGQSGTDSVTILPTRITRAGVARNLSVVVTTGPGAARTDTWTVVKNGADTALTVSLVGAAVSGTGTTPVSFAPGDTIALKQTVAASSTSADSQVTVDFD
jgi:hypothetical protein